MSSFNILHITDWHINDPNSQNEKLRAQFFMDYINGLYNELESQKKNKIDLIISSGDFIDKGKVDNFELVEKITNYIITKFSITKNQFITVIGNHDVKILDHKKADQSNYVKYANSFGPSGYLVDENLHKILKISDKVFCLKLDSIFNEQNEINNDAGKINIVRPSNITGASIDKIVTDVEEVVPKDSLLIIVSHFPMIMNNRMEMLIEEDGWVEKHLWKSGRIIVKRIVSNRKKERILCLYGDGHVDNFWSFSDRHHFFMTGCFGGDYVNQTYTEPKTGKEKAFNKLNDAKLIEYIDNNYTPQIFTLSYMPEGMVYNAQTGEWKTIISPYTIESLKEVDDVYKESEILELASSQINNIELISESIESEIIEYVKLNNLYTFTRTATSNDESSLGWVSISSLFQNKKLFAASIDKINEWIQKNTDNTGGEECILIGLGFWGAIFGSQINVRKNNLCTCISSKRIKGTQAHFESIDFIISQLNQQVIKEIIIFTDVISTGTSILALQEKLSTSLDVTKIKFYAICVIADKKQLPNKRISDFLKIGSLCTNIPIPVVSNENLPDEAIFPVSYDFR